MNKRSMKEAKQQPGMFSPFFQFTILFLSLSLGFQGCSTLDRMGITSTENAPLIDYAKKKSDWPTTFSEDATELSAAEELTPAEYVEQGDGFHRQGKLVLALTYYEKALAAEPDLFEVRLKIGNLFLRSGKPRKAKAYFVKILEDHAGYAPGFEGLGHVFFQLEQFEEAERHLLNALDLNPNLWKPHALLGIIYDLQGQHMEAITEHRAAIDHHAELGELHNNLGVSYSLAGDHRQASSAFQKALHKGASQNQVYNNLGLSLTRMGDYQRALDVLTYEGHEAQAFNNLGVLMLKDGFSQQAIACFEEALDAQPTFYPKASTNLKRARTMLRQQIQEGIPPSEGVMSPCSSIS